jgi:hypothetical protein
MVFFFECGSPRGQAVSEHRDANLTEILRNIMKQIHILLCAPDNHVPEGFFYFFRPAGMG